MKDVCECPISSSCGLLDEVTMIVRASQPTTRRGLTEAVISTRRATDDALEWYGYGNCHILAGALHEVSGWPFAIVAGDENSGSPKVIVHVGVMTPDGRFLDIAGAREHSEVLRQYASPGGSNAIYTVSLDDLVHAGQYRNTDGWRDHCGGEPLKEVVRRLAVTLVERARP
jgi:hypothetical protein